MLESLLLLGALLVGPRVPGDGGAADGATAGPAATPPATVGETVAEPRSKVAFPVTLAPPGGGDPLALTGLGVRTRTIFAVKVYAVGLYVDAAAARKPLARWAGRSAKELAADASFHEALLRDGFARSLRLVMTRDVDGDDLWKAFDDALGERVRERALARGLRGGAEALETWRDQLAVEELAKGTELVFTWLPGGRLVSRIGGKLRGEIRSPALCWALFDVYLGPEPVSGRIKRGLVRRFPELLAPPPADPEHAGRGDAE